MNKLKLQTTLKICYKRFIDWQNIKSKIGGWRIRQMDTWDVELLNLSQAHLDRGRGDTVRKKKRQNEVIMQLSKALTYMWGENSPQNGMNVP